MKRAPLTAFPFAFAALAAALGLAGALLLFTTFRTYDDEGYVLFSLAHFSRDGGLYTQVYSQYGPFFFLAADLAHRLLGFDFTHTAGRVITLVHWLGAAALCGHLVWRHSGWHGRPARDSASSHGRPHAPAAWSLFALAATFGHLWQMTSEPMHPGGFIVFLVALAAWSGAHFITREQPRALALTCGLIGAALVLTKINVGALFIAGAGAFLLLHSSAPRLARLGPWLAAFGLVALPWALMRSLLPELWIVTFATVIACSAVAILLASRTSPRGTGVSPVGLPESLTVVPPVPSLSPPLPSFVTPTAWLYCIAAGLTLLAVVVAAASLRGTGPLDLLEGVLLAPLRHPGVYSFGIRWRIGALAFAALSLVLCLVALRFRAHPRFAPTLAIVRLLATALAATAWLGWLPLNPLALVMSYGLSALWLFVLPLTATAEAHRAVRLRTWLALLLLTQSLHAYPVGGSQIGWGTFLFAPLLALAAAEALAALRPAAARWIAPAAIAAAAGIALAFLRIGSAQWRDSAPLALPGAASLRLEPPLATELRVLTVNATAHCDLLFSLPGQFSFNLWTGLPSPTAANVTHWFNLLTPAQQSAIIAKLAAHPRAGVIVERDVLGLIIGSDIPVRGPLRDYLYENFTAAFAAGSHEFWVRRDRPVAPLNTVRILHRAPTGTGERVRLEFVLTAANARVARIEWREGTQVRATFTPANARAELEPLRIDGASTAAPSSGWNTALAPISRLVLFTDDPAAHAPPRRAALFRLYDSAGTLLTEAILRD